MAQALAWLVGGCEFDPHSQKERNYTSIKLLKHSGIRFTNSGPISLSSLVGNRWKVKTMNSVNIGVWARKLVAKACREMKFLALVREVSISPPLCRPKWSARCPAPSDGVSRIQRQGAY